jgi:hypothetical protein
MPIRQRPFTFLLTRKMSFPTSPARDEGRTARAFSGVLEKGAPLVRRELTGAFYNQSRRRIEPEGFAKRPRQPADPRKDQEQAQEAQEF